MYRSENARDTIERDQRNDPRSRSHPDGETVVERKPIVADGPREAESPTMPDRRRTERRRIERMGTDI